MRWTMSVPYIFLSSWLSHLYAKNYQIWWRFDEVLTKKSWVIFWHTLYLSDCNFYARKQLLLSACLSHCNSVCPFVCLSVHLSVTWVDQSKTVQVRITKSLPSAAWKTLVSGTVKLFHKFEGGHPKRGH